MRNLFLTVLLTATACTVGGKPKSDTPNTTTKTWSQHCQEYTRIWAERAQSCVGGPAEGWALYKNPEIDCAEGERVLARGTIRFDQEQARACLVQIQGATCRRILDFEDEGHAGTPACGKVLAGTVAEGAPCHSGECLPGLFCSHDASACPGTCKPLVPVGSPCVVGDSCAEGAMCWGADINNRHCEPAPPPPAPLGEGEVCGSMVPQAPRCGPGLHCDEQPDGVGFCRKLPGEGEACEGICDVTFYCKGLKMVLPDQIVAPGTCAPLRKMKDTCSETTREAGGVIAYGDRCEALTVCWDGTCELQARLGEVCLDGQKSRGCLQGYCESSTGQCAPLKPDGVRCMLDLECAGGFCDSGACRRGGSCPIP
jgi:hypothetical protein